jgi:hypothetical protein
MAVSDFLIGKLMIDGGVCHPKKNELCYASDVFL